jgi:release factor glutamine methyltransferase
MPVERHASTMPTPASMPLKFREGLGEVAESLTGEELLRWRRELTSWGGEHGALDWLLDASGGLAPSRLRGLGFHPDHTVSLRRSRRELADLWRQHLDTGIPLQYLVGHCYWRDFSLEVGPAVLIPRPETELVVDLTLALLRERESAAPAPPPSELLWADLGTGSGCLAMGLARAFPHSQGLAVDVSPAALELARRNLASAGLDTRVHLIKGDWLDALQPWWGSLSVVVANPPYIPSAVVDQLDPPVRDHEPRLALDGGADGLASLRAIARLAPRALADGGCLLLEHHHDQSQAVIDLLAQHGLVDLRSHRDLEGHCRFVSGRRSVSSSPSAGGGRP